MQQNTKKRIEIHEELNCAWCEVYGQFIYGKTVDEIRSALDLLNRTAFFATLS